ncbi:Hypothetical Protein sle_02130 [Streptomyces leeuwenhoekii]|uniref:Uncharacterized protein n=1 Tax=Streptomyces leeuwenhoekii TaxID=1437453 RepID=A0A0F7VLK0_STRLW|nr:hypothetical protein [Streptomyces leeuwenhoekii]CQR59675.1 Hypothetical Protein sle_02130 [Streptomyces leeuwenhoekii]
MGPRPSLVPKAGDLLVCAPCHTDDITRREAADAAREQAAMQPAPEGDRGQEPGKARRGLFRRRG